ncbi:MAG: hypothetical protein COY38_04065 [Candidatus Aenigmarchaeota archaeon CG_4_10_14_0_8_um_filter_37_24]|nr:MAG: hypothetical protein COS07_03205 [Candidatus Aenigmarchaeota archaeon CG01_land_8_20_14_3_00_37_9]PIW40842.1 MAG: hypothetical protein COW21_05025 [Candidatus Aenigmarchaeota archaeon CG15_BIG_FIL_POST_REV_8_21_14_020_37_27]PIX51215.1 MAG: hypothetical protein COZ52_00050 [Candidatus Aenigmarchaeota archaeon CG_4_8_14_3_um_filter_37_24]PIY34815.1 MAG: hypothetical protein COZ04_05675 [Candidatus Aenigmarchaeota archaeon CG_4_10_14_3_um_filter_37_21]PIZ34548.1 MAG: hypothetical protein C
MIYNLILIILFISLALLYLFWIFIFLKKNKRKPMKNFSPNLSVIIPAHNEEKVIGKTIESILNSQYFGKIEVIVIDDGSKDNTGKIAKSMQKKGGIKLFKTNHIGKSKALNFGATKSSYNYILFLDADSVLEEITIKEIVKPLQYKRFGASSGVVRGIITSNPLTWFQDLEYIMSSAWRYASSLLGTASVLPGFFCVKKDVFKKIGGFSSDTLTEDFDITLEIKKAGYDSFVNLNAVMYTLTPNNIKSLYRQRLRWGRGNLQVVRKHSDMIFSKKFGFLGCMTIPTHIYWYIFSLFYLPSVLYWMLGDYFRYFASSGNIISPTVLIFFFKWISTYGMYDLIYKVIAGVYSITPLLLVTIINYLITVCYNLIVFFKLGKIRFVNIIAYFFTFPYYLFTIFVQCFVVVYESYSLIKRKKITNVWDK